MPLIIAVGMQWGDEGKGRVVDLLSERAEIVARYNGGDNAGHTVTVGEQIYKLHIIPSGIVHPHVRGILGNGMVINPTTLLEEISMLRTSGVLIDPSRLMISDLAHLITPGHRLLDRAQEEALGKNQIGTTGRGIGPAYVDKAARRGIRVGEILDERIFYDRVKKHFDHISFLLNSLYNQAPLDVKPLTDKYVEQACQLAPFIRHIGPSVKNVLDAGQIVLAEGAQGTLLDLDFGSYPYVTSSCTTSTGVFSGLGIGLRQVERVIGITKAFQTRVGSGSFPTEVLGENAEVLRGTGANPWDEFGTTTGRPRRVGWLDSVLLRYACQLNGTTELFLTKLDVLSGLPEIPVCVAYQKGTEVFSDITYPNAASILDQIKPLYQTLPGWQADLRKIMRWMDLPSEAQNYVEFIESMCGIPVKAISVGPERSSVIWRD